MLNRRFKMLLASVGLSILVFVWSSLSGNANEMNWVLGTTALMASLWITEAIPMGATSLLPIAIFPLTGVLDIKEVTPLYASHIIFLFIAGFLLAFAMERWQLHRRIAFKIIGLIGFEPKRILLGFVLASFILSMWINNTATTIVLLAPALAIINEFKSKSSNQWFGVVLLLGIAYASSIGGTVTPIGTAPNLLLKSYFESSFPELPEINFLSWMRFALPLGIIFTVVLFLYLARKLKGQQIDFKADSLKEQIRNLGKLSYEERVVLVIFIALAVMWMSAKSIEIGGVTIHGWTSLFPEPGFIKDSAIGMAVVMLLFFIPSKSENRNILEWEDAKRLPFDILFIFGGGFALAKAFEKTGIDDILVTQLEPLSALPIWLMILIICLFMTFATEITSNTATTQLILPLLIIVIKATNVEPMYLLVPATFSASYAFMLPVATPPNAIVFGTGEVSNKHMMKIGIWLNLIGVILLTLYTYFFAEYF
jgi:sodium-dependent dicarboxylate transporter 2/3/5